MATNHPVDYLFAPVDFKKWRLLTLLLLFKVSITELVVGAVGILVSLSCLYVTFHMTRLLYMLYLMTNGVLTKIKFNGHKDSKLLSLFLASPNRPVCYGSFHIRLCGNWAWGW